MKTERAGRWCRRGVWLWMMARRRRMRVRMVEVWDGGGRVGEEREGDELGDVCWWWGAGCVVGSEYGGDMGEMASFDVGSDEVRTTATRRSSWTPIMLGKVGWRKVFLICNIGKTT